MMHRPLTRALPRARAAAAHTLRQAPNSTPALSHPVSRAMAGQTTGPSHTAIPEQIKHLAKNTRKGVYTRADISFLLLTKKAQHDKTFAELAQAVGGGRSEVYITSAIYGQQPLSKEEATKLVGALDITDSTEKEQAIAVLQTVPVRGFKDWSELQNDPTIYRLLEVVKVYGVPLKALIHEHFGDGIMSAIDFNLGFEETKGSQGEKRVKITLDGKFLPYTKY